MLSKTIDKTVSKLESPTKRGPNKCPVYLRLPYIRKEAKLLEKNYSTFRADNLRITRFTRKPLN